MSFNLRTLGRHVLIELYGCKPKIIEDNQLIEKLMNEAAVESGATIVDSVFHMFNPYGVSGAVIIEESHLTIHTWPEYEYASVDVYTCGDSVDPWVAEQYLAKVLGASAHESFEIPRGMSDKIKRHCGKPIENITVKLEDDNE